MRVPGPALASLFSACLANPDHIAFSVSLIFKTETFKESEDHSSQRESKTSANGHLWWEGAGSLQEEDSRKPSGTVWGEDVGCGPQGLPASIALNTSFIHHSAVFLHFPQHAVFPLVCRLLHVPITA